MVKTQITEPNRGSPHSQPPHVGFADKEPLLLKVNWVHQNCPVGGQQGATSESFLLILDARLLRVRSGSATARRLHGARTVRNPVSGASY